MEWACTCLQYTTSTQRMLGGILPVEEQHWLHHPSKSKMMTHDCAFVSTYDVGAVGDNILVL